VKKFLALAVCVVAVGCGDDSTTTTNNGTDRATTIAAMTGSTTDGETVYGQLCAVCHGANGAGTAAGNSMVDSTKTKDEVIDSILNGVSGTTMVSFASRTDQEIANLTAYTLAFQQ
jgi:mono/diheme cytochrome c family protein